jgi:hypothetical protein
VRPNERSNNLAGGHHSAPTSEKLCSSIFRQQSVHLTEFRRILTLVDLPDQGLGGAGWAAWAAWAGWAGRQGLLKLGTLPAICLCILGCWHSLLQPRACLALSLQPDAFHMRKSYKLDQFRSSKETSTVIPGKFQQKFRLSNLPADLDDLDRI